MTPLTRRQGIPSSLNQRQTVDLDTWSDRAGQWQMHTPITPPTGHPNGATNKENKMKKIGISVLLSSIAVMLMTGCTAVAPSYGGNSPVGGWVYTDTQAPSQALHAQIDPTAQPLKIG